MSETAATSTHAPTPSPQGDEFYVGYLPAAPPGIRRRTRVAVAVVLALGVVLAAGLAVAFRSPGDAIWDGGVATFYGQLSERPYPMLRWNGPDGSVQRALVVASGKHGAASQVAGLDGRWVRLVGTVLQRDGRLMLELAEGADAVTAASGLLAGSTPPDSATPVDRGHLSAAGEIVDSKCFLGAMKPGDGKLHKACAIRCISGGIPPMLVARNAGGGFSYYLLTSAEGGMLNTRVLPFVAEPVVVSGTVEEVDGWLIMRVGDEPGSIRRASGR